MEDKKRVTVYLVRLSFRTTAKHPLGPGLDAVYYFGKNGHTVGRRGSYVEAEKCFPVHDPLPYELIQYGYKRIGDAKRAAAVARDWYAKLPHDAFEGHAFDVVAEGYWK